jgi:hypothetical protein
MNQIGKLEARMASWYGKLPHLPETWRLWLANNSWWIVLAYVVMIGLALLALLQIVLIGGMVLPFMFGAFGAALGGLLFIMMVLWLAFNALDIVLLVFAIRPLRAKQKKGWTLLFIVLLITVAATIVRALWNGRVVELVSGLLNMIVSGYLLFECREYFNVGAVVLSAKKRTVHSHKLKTRTDIKA